MAEIVADIANASNEQSTGIEQVNKALTQMDEVTQQNSALVEENAATAKTLEHQAKAMDERVAFFKLNAAAERSAGGEACRTARSHARAAPGRGAAVAGAGRRCEETGDAETTTRCGAQARRRGNRCWRTGPPHAGRARNRRQ